MKIKNRDLLRKYVLYERGIWKKPRNFPLLLAAAKRRIGWRVDVLYFQRFSVKMLYEEFQKDHHYMDCHIWYGFEELFNENMERKK